MNPRSTLLLPLLCLAFAALPSLAASPAATMRINALEDKTNATVDLKQALVAEIGNTGQLNGFTAITSYKGANVPVWAIVNDAKMTEDRYEQLAQFQSRIDVKLTCKRMRVGSSPDIPQIKIAMLAEECVVDKINH